MIRLGTGKYNGGAPICLSHKHSDSICFFAPPRSGKSLLAENIVLQIQHEGRRILILDTFSSEWKNCVWMNMRSRYRTDYLRNAEILSLDTFGFCISQFNTLSSWTSLGFNGENAKLMLHLATSPKWQRVYNDDPDDFYDLVKSLPANLRESIAFSRQYGRFDINFQTANSARARMDAIHEANIFVTPEKAARTPSWFKLLKQHNLIIDFNLGLKDAEISKARAYAGLILRALRTETKDLELLKTLKPFIVVEEADMLAPNLAGTNEHENLASIELNFYVSKMGKFGGYILFLTQNETMIHGNLERNSRTKILGRLSHGRYADLTKHIQLNTEQNYREFGLLDEGRWAVFIPDDVSGGFARYFEDNQMFRPQKLNTSRPTQWI